MGSCTSENNVSLVWNVEQFDIEQFGDGTTIIQHFGSLKVSDK